MAFAKSIAVSTLMDLQIRRRRSRIGRRRNIEVPRYTQPQFELGNTAEDIKEGEGAEGEERTGE